LLLHFPEIAIQFSRDKYHLSREKATTIAGKKIFISVKLKLLSLFFGSGAVIQDYNWWSSQAPYGYFAIPVRPHADSHTAIIRYPWKLKKHKSKKKGEKRRFSSLF